ncbi:S10 family peptidase [Parvularcula dongshanensis]|uniref:Carboxypeptidase C (Cathepsin A) n=1 Tax=Parvularcula dongshanensis TaxID=1173995 RepID=A0A840I0X4_9PROT|nr:hypothetical protein [Parvularcula dongshanensis]MBB4657848.1 carboxypeptidase C (cathepsin A) [Parvularcula dongshanensis]
MSARLLLRPLLVAGALLAAVAVLPAEAQEKGADEAPGKAAPAAETPPQRFESEGEVSLGGRTVAYRAVAGETYLRAEDGTPRAAIFSVTYTQTEDTDPAERPVIFVFNGGPGSASLWLHLGAFGPKRIDWPYGIGDDGSPPYPLVDNEGCLLDVADLVFIDPVGTGYSRALGETKPEAFWGVKNDAASIGEFIRRWLTEHHRWASPRYLAGESYGTTRAAAVAEELTAGYDDVTLNGIVLISSILDFELADGKLSGVGLLPTEAAIAWYHGKVDKDAWGGDFERFMSEARSFAANDLAPVLLLGQGAPEEAVSEVTARMAAFTGLSEDYLRRADLEVGVFRFMKELRRDDGLVVGRLDGRFTGEDSDRVGETAEADPSFYAIDGAYSSAVNDYLTRTLGVTIDRQYQVLSGAVGQGWKAQEPQNELWSGYVDVGPGLARAMRENDEMRVLLAAGYYDLATPMFAAEMSMSAYGMPQDRIVTRYFEGGHMMYLEDEPHRQLSDDVRAFVEGEAEDAQR